MKDKRGEYYVDGHCSASDRDCDYKERGACGICPIGGAYRKVLFDLKSQEGDLSELCGETLKT